MSYQTLRRRRLFGRPGWQPPNPAAPVSGPAFPDPSAVLDLRTEIQLNGAWTDVSAYVLYGSDYPRGPAITRGQADESPRTTASVLSFPFNNSDGRFSSRNPAGAYYPYLTQNTPIRVSVPEGASYLRCEGDNLSYASTPDSAAISITGDTEIQIDVTLDNWNSAQVLAGKWLTTGSQRSWVLELNEDGTLFFRWSADGGSVNVLTATSAVAVPVPALRRQAIKVTVAVATGTVTFYAAPAATNQVLSGPITSGWVQVGPAVVAGAGNIFDSTAPITVGSVPGSMAPFGLPGIYGKIHSFKLLSGIGGTVKASPDFTAATAGVSSLSDAQGDIWSVEGTAEISDRRYRMHGEIAEWPQTWTSNGEIVWANVTANGPLRRLVRSSKPLRSALNRYWTRLSGSGAPLAYWACEDASGSTQIASGLSGGQPMRFAKGIPALASATPVASSDALPVLDSSTWIGTVPPYSSGTDAVMKLVVATPAAGDTNNTFLAALMTSGPLTRTVLIYSGGALSVNGYDSTNSLLFNSAASAVIDGIPQAVNIELHQNGTGVDWTFEIVRPNGSVVTQTGTAPLTSFGSMIQVIVNPVSLLGNQSAGGVIGHIAVQSVVHPLSEVTTSFNAFTGEAAGTRFARLCSEEGIAFRASGRLSTTPAMGPQISATLDSLLKECADVDRGVIFEPRQAFGLGYRTRYSLSNQAPAIALDYAGADLTALQPTDDDQNTLNDVTVSRANGSSSRQIATSGAKSVQAPPNGVGTYDTEFSRNLWSDSQVADAAGWAVHLGTVNELRYPLASLELARSAVANIFYDLQDADIGDRYTVANVLAQLGPDDISQLIKQYVERPGGKLWSVDWAGAPESPYQTMVFDDATVGRYDTDGSFLSNAIGSSDVTILVSTVPGFAYPLWTTAAGDFPFDINVGGERMTVTNITGATSPQTFTVTRSVNGIVKAHSAGESVALFTTPYFAM